MKTVIVYCAKMVDGPEPVLVPSHFGFRAREVRASVGRMFDKKNPESDGWRMAAKQGWRTEQCVIQSAKDWAAAR